ncbi:hypothetical protein [Mucilaginibacter sp.]|jgi:hypothetical protein|uniref:hypothetical protein n=1 Tax=Mucilaginibacter sp. TaxID=1882438 RepID=UPI003568861D
MKTIHLKLYSFSELDEKAREKALAELSGINVDFDWWDFIYDDVIAIAKTIGITINPKRIYFRGFYSQGDGSTFSATIDLPGLWEAISKENWKSYAELARLDFALPDMDRRIIRLLKEGKLDVNPKIEQPRNGYYVRTELNACLPCNGNEYPLIEKQLEILEKGLQEIANMLNDHLFYSLREEYEYQTSETAVKETIESNEYWFTSDGKTATRIDNLADEPQLNE